MSPRTPSTATLSTGRAGRRSSPHRATYVRSGPGKLRCFEDSVTPERPRYSCEIGFADRVQVLNAVLKMVAPIVPHLAEEVYESMAQAQRKKSVFLEHWTESVGRHGTEEFLVADTIFQESWIDKEAADEMGVLLAIRGEVLGMLESARQDKCVSCFHCQTSC